MVLVQTKPKASALPDLTFGLHWRWQCAMQYANVTAQTVKPQPVKLKMRMSCSKKKHGVGAGHATALCMSLVFFPLMKRPILLGRGRKGGRDDMQQGGHGLPCGWLSPFALVRVGVVQVLSLVLWCNPDLRCPRVWGVVGGEGGRGLESLMPQG